MEWVAIVISLIATVASLWASHVAHKAFALQRRADEREAQRFEREISPPRFEVELFKWENPTPRPLYGIRLVNRSDRDHRVERVTLFDREGKFVAFAAISGEILLAPGGDQRLHLLHNDHAEALAAVSAVVRTVDGLNVPVASVAPPAAS